MPTYEYQCGACEHQFSMFLPMSRSGDRPPCPECGAEQTIKRVSQNLSVIFAGDDWSTKNNRIRGQMAKKNQRLDEKQKERKMDAPVAQLVPNVNGERFDSWSDAQKFAGSKGLNTTSYNSVLKKDVTQK